MNPFAIASLAPVGLTGPLDLTAAAATRKSTAADGSFSALLSQFISDTERTLRAGETTAMKGITGNASTQEVVEAVMAAEQALQAGIAIRDKVVSAYLEISRMAI